MDLIWSEGELLVAGPDQSAFVTVQRPGTTITGLRFHPGAAPALIGVPAGVVRGQRVPLRELNARLADRSTFLVDRGASPTRALLGTVVAAREAAVCPEVPGAHLVRVIARLLGAGASVADTAAAIGWTTRTLHRHANDTFGYGPAVLRRVLRFRRALDLVWRDVPAAEAAARAGYADQSHLARELRALAGVSLTELLAESGPAGRARERQTARARPA
jgi:AraC-like DNA-binding protein